MSEDFKIQRMQIIHYLYQEYWKKNNHEFIQLDQILEGVKKYCKLEENIFIGHILYLVEKGLIKPETMYYDTNNIYSVRITAQGTDFYEN